jgi:hypothetical protein
MTKQRGAASLSNDCRVKSTLRMLKDSSGSVVIQLLKLLVFASTTPTDYIIESAK